MSKPPILLLKTQSQPTDPYQTILSPHYTPHFLPVLTHTLLPTAQTRLFTLFSAPETFLSTYNSIILTSQRAVEALNGALSNESPGGLPATTKSIRSIWSHVSPPSRLFPIFVVGPATHASVEALVEGHFLLGFFAIVGQESGNGEALVEYILRYAGGSGDCDGEGSVKRALFPTGEKRRDTVPRLLSEAGWVVDEVPCYETVTRGEFAQEFVGMLKKCDGVGVVWVVVFSPQGCKEMLWACGWMDVEAKVMEEYRTPEGRRRQSEDRIRTWVRVMSIGPTTRQFLLDQFEFQVDSVAVAPSAGGILQGLESDRYPVSIKTGS